MVEQHEHYTGEPSPKLAYCPTPRLPDHSPVCLCARRRGAAGERRTNTRTKIEDSSQHKHTQMALRMLLEQAQTTNCMAGAPTGRVSPLPTPPLLRMILRKSATKSFSPLGFERVDSIQNVSHTYLQMENVVSTASPHPPVVDMHRVLDASKRLHQMLHTTTTTRARSMRARGVGFDLNTRLLQKWFASVSANSGAVVVGGRKQAITARVPVPNFRRHKMWRDESNVSRVGILPLKNTIDVNQNWIFRNLERGTPEYWRLPKMI